MATVKDDKINVLGLRAPSTQSLVVTFNVPYKVDLQNCVGKGTFGIVYQGLDGNERKVAVKRVRKLENLVRNNDQGNAIEQDVSYPHVIKIFSVENFSGSWWIIMEHCDLGNLDQFFKHHHEMIQRKVEKKVKIMLQLADAIAYLHSQGIIHRDIKPSNVLVNRRGENAIVKLSEIGLSTTILDPDSLTLLMNSDFKTLAYKAPEFWKRDHSGKVSYDKNVDIFSVGLTFLAMLQYMPGGRLLPEAEGHLFHSENNLPIGYILFSRINFGSVVIEDLSTPLDIVVVDKPEVPVQQVANMPIKQVKSLIQRMTLYSAKDRPCASEVDESLSQILKDYFHCSDRHSFMRVNILINNTH